MQPNIQTANNGSGAKNQIHFWGSDIDNLYHLDFDQITDFSFGHHGRAYGGNDIFNFINTQNVNATIVGRFEDFDPSSDQIQIEGVPLDLYNLPSNVRIVEFNGIHNDANTSPQQWLLIDTGGGHIFYSLSGARIDLDGNGRSNNGTQEGHFIREHEVPDFASLQDVDYVDPQNFVPAGLTADGGVIINDVDRDVSDLEEEIEGTNFGDLIAGGINSDLISATGGNDTVWGGDGNDEINGGNGDDFVYGGNGIDILKGGSGHDSVYGGVGDDRLTGVDGDDRLFGQDGDDKLYGGDGDDRIVGGRGNDRLLAGDGNDFIISGSGDDKLFGGAGADVFHFDHGCDENAVNDFEVGIDLIELDNFGYSNTSEVLDHATQAGSNVVFDFGDGDILTIRNATLSELNDSFDLV